MLAADAAARGRTHSRLVVQVRRILARALPASPAARRSRPHHAWSRRSLLVGAGARQSAPKPPMVRAVSARPPDYFSGGHRKRGWLAAHYGSLGVTYLSFGFFEELSR